MKQYIRTVGGEIINSDELQYNDTIKQYVREIYDDIKHKKIFEVVIIEAESDRKEDL